jgi:hypothetical protein
MNKDGVLDKESVDEIDSESWMNEVVFTGFLIKALAKDTARLKAQLENSKDLQVCFIRTSASYLFITGQAPESVKGA